MPKLEATESSFKKRMDELWYVYILQRLFAGMNKQGMKAEKKIERKLNSILLTKRTQSAKRYTGYGSALDLSQKAEK